MAWIELHQTMNTHRKTLRLSSLLKISRRETIGLLCDLWLWAVDNADKNGLLEGLSDNDIGMALGMKGRESERTVQALVDVGYIDIEDGQYVLHDWYDYCGKLNEKRATDRKRKAESRRTSSGSPAEVQRTSRGSPLVTVPNPTVPNHISTTTTSNARAREADDILSVTDEEVEDHRKLIERLEGKARDYGLPFAVGDIERTLRLVNEYSEDWVMQAIDRCSLRERRSWGTVQGILRSWKEKGGIDDGIPDTARPRGRPGMAQESGGGLSESRFPIEQYGGIVV